MESLNFCGRRGTGGCAPVDAEDIQEPDLEQEPTDYAGEPWVVITYTLQ